MTSIWNDQGLNSKDTQKISHTRQIAITTSTPDWLVVEAIDSSGQVLSRVNASAGSLPQILIDVFWFVDTSGSMKGTPSANVNASFAAMQTQLGALGADTTIRRFNNGSWKENVFRDFRNNFVRVTQNRRAGSQCHIIGASDTGVWTSSIGDTPDLINQLRANGPCDLWMYAVAGGESGDAIGGGRGYDSAFNTLYGNTNNMLRDTSSIVQGIADRVVPVETDPLVLSNIPDAGTITIKSYLSTNKNGPSAGGTEVQTMTETCVVGDRTGPNFNISVTTTRPVVVNTYN